jgi:hypothetical protein
VAAPEVLAQRQLPPHINPNNTNPSDKIFITTLFLFFIINIQTPLERILTTEQHKKKGIA